MNIFFVFLQQSGWRSVRFLQRCHRTCSLERTCSVCCSIFSGLTPALQGGKAFTTFMSKSMSDSIVPTVTKGPTGQDVLYLNTESLSVKSHTIHSIEAPQTVKCQAINSLPLPVRLSLISFADNRPCRGKSALFNYHKDYEVWVIPNANSQTAAVHFCIRSILPFHLASVADGLQLIFAHLIWGQNTGLEDSAWATCECNEVLISD